MAQNKKKVVFVNDTVRKPLLRTFSCLLNKRKLENDSVN